MKLNNIFGLQYGGAKAMFHCEYDSKLIEEDKSFQKATPCGMAEFQIDNPTAAAQLVIGETYYFDITPVNQK